MSAATVLAALLAAVSVLLAGAHRSRARRRLGGLRLPERGHPPTGRTVQAAKWAEAAGREEAAGLAQAAERRRWGACALAGVGVATVVGGATGLVAGALAALAAQRLLARVESPQAARARARVLADLPVAAELLAAGASAGAALDDVALAVADALGGPLGAELGRVVALVRLGADPAQTWAGLGEAAGVPALSGFGRAVARAITGGAPLVPALLQVAAQQRADARLRAGVAARRVGVLAVAPLTLCFLPAFVLVGVVPVVVSVAGSVLAPLSGSGP